MQRLIERHRQLAWGHSELGGRDLSAAIELLVLRALLAAAVVQFAVVCLLGLQNPFFGWYGFRQSQTAIAVYYMLHGGAWLGNIIPVFGEPWVLPIEFPLFQWIVAVLVQLTGLSIDTAGRVTSAAFTLAVLWPIRLIAEETSFGRRGALITSILWLSAPVTLLWGGSFLIESFSVFLSATWLAYYMRWYSSKNWTALAICSTFAVVAIVSKVTTFFGFALLAAAFTLYHAWLNRTDLLAISIRLIGGAAGVLLGVIAMMAWSRYSDAWLIANPIATTIRFQNLSNWYFGTWADRINPVLWSWVVKDRSLGESIGAAWYLLPIAAIAAWRCHRALATALLSLGIFLTTFAVFPKLYLNHYYYQLENALLFIMVAAILVVALRRTWGAAAAFYLLALLLVSQVKAFYSHENGRGILVGYENNSLYEASREVKRFTSPDSVVVVFGNEWSSEIPYYSERYAIVVPNGFPEQSLRQVLFAERARWLGERTIGAVVDCWIWPRLVADKAARAMADQLIAEMRGRTSELKHCRVHLAG